MITVLRLVAIPFLCLALAGCQSLTEPSEPDGQWATAEVQAGSERILLEVAVLSLERQSFPIGAGVDPEGLSITTGWKNHLAPFRGDGYRIQALIQSEPLGSGRFRVSVRVKKQINQSIAKPLDLSYAEWEWVEDDTDMARILLQHVRSYFAPELKPPAPAR